VTTHAHEVTTSTAPAAPGRGNKISIGMLGMGIFIGSEFMLFASLFTAYFMIRFNINTGVWPPDGIHLPKLITGLNTLILVSSSFTVWYAEHSIKHNDRKGLIRGLSVTIFLGLTFLFIQINEYIHLEFTPQNSAFGSIFFTLTGFHGAHVFIGLTLLTFCLRRAMKGDFTSTWSTPLNASSVYWHFVDVVWVLLYLLVYLL
jgi:cytochrome c oxidase subunit III